MAHRNNMGYSFRKSLLNKLTVYMFGVMFKRYHGVRVAGRAATSTYNKHVQWVRRMSRSDEYGL